MSEPDSESEIYLWRGWVPHASPAPLVMVKGAGIEVFDDQGRAYLDAQAAYSGASCGYGVDEIVNAVVDQSLQLPNYPLEHSHNLPALALARIIGDLMPGELKRVFFCTSGSDAVEAAIKMARLAQRLRGWSNRSVILTLPDAYHGATMAAMSASDIGPAREGFEPFAGDITRMRSADAAGLAEALAEFGAGRIAAVLLEPVRGVGGVLLLPPTELVAIAALCREHGILLMADEIMTGFGRTGRWFAFEHAEIQPDIVTLEKGLTGGYAPLAAVVASRAVHAIFGNDPILGGFRHGHTFCGHPVACAAGVATVEVIRRQRLVENAATVGAQMLEAAACLKRHRVVRDVRGLGLLLGVEVSDDKTADRIKDAAFRRGLLLRPQRKVLTVAPPLSISAAQASQMVAILDDSCGEIASA